MTPFHLAVEVIPNSGFPSKASGVTAVEYTELLAQADDTDNELDDDANKSKGCIAWLLEARRSGKVERWSGTNEYPMWGDNKLGNTLNAFTHFAYMDSYESIVFADLQSALPAVLPAATDILISNGLC